MDFGKEKFGGPFTEEEVEDVKTVLQLMPLILCISISVSSQWPLVSLDAFDDQNMYLNCLLNDGVPDWLPPIILIPLYQILLYPLFHKWVPSMLRRIGVGLLLTLVGTVLCAALIVKGYTLTGDWTTYLTCSAVNNTDTETPEKFVDWYWKLVPLLLYSVGSSLAYFIQLEFIFAQSPDKMKGLVLGVMLALTSIGVGFGEALQAFFQYTLCYDIPVLLLLTVLFLFFLFLSKRYTLRERNKEVNIQAIVEEHYERYLDQEEEYMREQHYRYTGHYCRTDI